MRQVHGNRHDKNAPEPEVALKPTEFAEIFKDIPADWVLIGGQSIAMWVERYKLNYPATSKDIDFWGNATKLKALAKKLNTKVLTPSKYDTLAVAR